MKLFNEELEILESRGQALSLNVHDLRPWLYPLRKEAGGLANTSCEKSLTTASKHFLVSSLLSMLSGTQLLSD